MIISIYGRRDCTAITITITSVPIGMVRRGILMEIILCNHNREVETDYLHIKNDPQIFSLDTDKIEAREREREKKSMFNLFIDEIIHTIS